MMNKTQKLYYEDSHIFEFTAEITDIVYENGETLAVLDKTAFFPGGGGQPSDSGFIGGEKAASAFEKEGIIYHRMKGESAFKTGEKVFCKLDADKRFVRMQAHSGEHILSGIAHRLFGAENVGFHMDDAGLMTVDFNIRFSDFQLQRLEKESNRCVYKNFPVRILNIKSSEADSVSFRSKKELSGDIRLVEIAGVDRCACCAPHIAFTGEIGLIKILSCISHRGGSRMTVICGEAAYEDYCEKYRQIRNISSMLCAKNGMADKAVERLAEQNAELKRTAGRTRTRLNEYRAGSLAASPVICAYFEKLEMNDLFETASLLKDKCKYAAVVFSENGKNGFSFCLCSRGLKLKDLSLAIRQSLGGSCGGSGELLQGNITAEKEAVFKFFTASEVSRYANA